MNDDEILAGAISDYFKRMELDWEEQRLQAVPLGWVQSEINSACWVAEDTSWVFDPMVSPDDSELLADAVPGSSGDDFLSIDHFEDLHEIDELLPVFDGWDAPANDRYARKRAPETHLAPVESAPEEDDVPPIDKAYAFRLVLGGFLPIGLFAAFFHFV